MKLDDVLLGNQTAREVWDGIGDATERLINIIRENGPKSPKIPTGVKAPKDRMKGGKPTEKMIATAKSVAERKGVKLPKGYSSNFDTCRDFLDEHLGGKPADPLTVIEKKLSSGIIPGLGPKPAKILVENFGVDTYRIIREEPEKLKGIKGVSAKVVSAITEAVASKSACRDIAKFLQDHGLPAIHAARFYLHWGEETVAVLKENPWAIASELPHLPLALSKRLAEKLGKMDGRLQAACLHYLHILRAPRGKDLLAGEIAAQENVSPEQVLTVISSLKENGSVASRAKNGVELIMLADIKKDQDSITKQFKALAGESCPLPPMEIDKALQWVEGQLKLSLTDCQKKAVGTALLSKILVLNGMPGTGRDTVLSAIVTILKAKKLDFLVAPNNQQMSEKLSKQLGEETIPLVKALEWNEKTKRFKRTAKKPLEADFVILPEAGKLDRKMLNAALKALPEEATLLMVEDLDQPAPAHAGNLIYDLVHEGILPNLHLKELHQNRSTSLLLENLARSRRQEDILPQAPEGFIADFFQLKSNGPDETIGKVIELAKNRLPKKLKCDPIQDIQIISSHEEGPLSPARLNPVLSQHLNQKADHLYADRFGWRFRKGDKLRLKADLFDQDLCCGETGHVKDLDPESQRLTIQFGKAKLTLPYDELDILEPAYCHRSNATVGMTNKAIIVLSDTNSPDDLLQLGHPDTEIAAFCG